MSQLQSIVQFNEEMLEGSHPVIRELLAAGDDDASGDWTVTDALLEDDETVRCWTCGSEVQRSKMEETIERLRSLQEEKLSERDDLEEQDDLEQRREEIRDELEDLRTRTDWIERVGQTVREGPRKVEQTTFALHIVRSIEGGSTYEDTINHLGENEREVTGLIFALAGYLVHEVYEEVPFMLLDSLEAIGSRRTAHSSVPRDETTETAAISALSGGPLTDTRSTVPVYLAE